MDDEVLDSAFLSNIFDKIVAVFIGVELVDPESTLDRYGERCGRRHHLHAGNHDFGSFHQAGPECPLLYLAAGAADLKVR